MRLYLFFFLPQSLSHSFCLSLFLSLSFPLSVTMPLQRVVPSRCGTVHSLNTVVVGYHESLLKKQINRVREMMIYVTLEPHTYGAINGEIDDKEIFWCPSAFTQPGKASEITAGVRNRSYFKAHTVPTLENSLFCGSCSSFVTKLCLVCCSIEWTDRTELKAQLQGPGFGNLIAWSANKVPGDFKA